MRILHIMGGANAGGVSAVVMNFYQYIDKSKFHFDFALTGNEIGYNGRQLQAMGSQFYFLPKKSDGIRAFERALAELLQKHHYDAIHVHGSVTSYVALRVAKKVGIKCRVAHSHVASAHTSFKQKLVRFSGKILNYHYATKVVGCGQLAGEYAFGKRNMRRERATVLPNAIETERFAFNEQIRARVRKEMRWEDKYVIGLVGRLTFQKNQSFALKALQLVHQRLPESILVFVGVGEDEQKLRREVADLGLQDAVSFLGHRSDVDQLYQAFDIHILPSRFEGFPVVGVEAMASGLPQILADTITPELSFGSAVYYLSLNSPNAWADQICALRTDTGRAERTGEALEHGFEIKITAHQLEQIYAGI